MFTSVPFYLPVLNSLYVKFLLLSLYMLAVQCILI